MPHAPVASLLLVPAAAAACFAPQRSAGRARPGKDGSRQRLRAGPGAPRRRTRARRRTRPLLPCRSRVAAPLGPGSPSPDRPRRGTRLLPGPRGSRPSRCYSHQDLHRRRLRARPRARFAGPCAPPYYAPRACAESARGSAPSIFGAPEFGRYVATRFLADADLYGHRPAVPTRAPPSWSLCAAPRRLIRAPGSSLFAGPAYHSRPTRRPHAPGARRAPACGFGVWECPRPRTRGLAILSTPQRWRAPAVLRDISGGTSYQTVRLVFRPYTQVLPSS